MKCVIYGCGAIGKAVAGVSMRGIGAEVTFVEARPQVVDAIRSCGSYRVYENEQDYRSVSDISVVPANSEEANIAAREADCIVTCVGPKALPFVIKSIAEALIDRDRKLLLLLYENDADCIGVTERVFGKKPDWLYIEKASIERMSREYIHDDFVDALSEPWIPVILNRRVADVIAELDNPVFFHLVDDVHHYYLRKLYTNNLGHAVLGYFGLKKGYVTCYEAIQDTEIRRITEKAIRESAEMLIRTLGFERNDMEAHIRDLMERRYNNEGLSDDLERLARDPMRKLGPDERIIGAARRCFECGIDPQGICMTARCALEVLGGDRRIVLKEVCGLNEYEPLFKRLI